MPKLNYTQFSKPASKAKPFETKVGDYVFSIVLQRLGGDVQESVNDQVSKLAQRFVFGGWTGEDGVFRVEPDVYMGDNGKPIEISVGLLTRACTIERAQCQPEAERYELSELLTISQENDDLWAWLKGCYNSLFLPTGDVAPGEAPAL